LNRGLGKSKLRIETVRDLRFLDEIEAGVEAFEVDDDDY